MKKSSYRIISCAIIFSIFFCNGLSFSAETIENLIDRMTDKASAWKVRCLAEDALVSLPSQAVLPKLLPYISMGMPSGAIWNSGGRDIDQRAPIEWQIFYSVSRIWEHHIDNLPQSEGGRLLLDLLKTASTVTAKDRLIMDLQRFWIPEAEPILAELLNDPRQDISLRYTAGLALILRGEENYQDSLLKYAEASNHKEKIRWYDLLSDSRYKKRKGVDSRVIIMGFELLKAEKESSQNYIHGAYFLATKVGDYVGVDFKPEQGKQEYQGKYGLNDRFFEDAVDNALHWWDTNGQRIGREISLPK